MIYGNSAKDGEGMKASGPNRLECGQPSEGKVAGKLIGERRMIRRFDIRKETSVNLSRLKI